jgi:hypothetical protein
VYGQAVRLARQCVDYAHCTFGSGFGGLLLAYVLANGGKTYKVLNGCGLGGPLSDLECLAPPPPRGKHLVLDSTPTTLHAVPSLASPPLSRHL